MRSASTKARPRFRSRSWRANSSKRVKARGLALYGVMPIASLRLFNFLLKGGRKLATERFRLSSSSRRGRIFRVAPRPLPPRHKKLPFRDRLGRSVAAYFPPTESSLGCPLRRGARANLFRRRLRYDFNVDIEIGFDGADLYADAGFIKCWADHLDALASRDARRHNGRVLDGVPHPLTRRYHETGPRYAFSSLFCAVTVHRQRTLSTANIIRFYLNREFGPF